MLLKSRSPEPIPYENKQIHTSYCWDHVLADDDKFGACDGLCMHTTSFCASVYCSIAAIVAPECPEQKAAQQDQPALQQCSLQVRMTPYTQHPASQT